MTPWTSLIRASASSSISEMKPSGSRLSLTCSSDALFCAPRSTVLMFETSQRPRAPSGCRAPRGSRKLNTFVNVRTTLSFSASSIIAAVRPWMACGLDVGSIAGALQYLDRVHDVRRLDQLVEKRRLHQVRLHATQTCVGVTDVGFGRRHVPRENGPSHASSTLATSAWMYGRARSRRSSNVLRRTILPSADSTTRPPAVSRSPRTSAAIPSCATV